MALIAEKNERKPEILEREARGVLDSLVWRERERE